MMQRVTGQSEPKVMRLASLDGLRGLAAVIVAFGYHGQILFDPAIFPDGGLGLLVNWLHTYGWTMVDLFFVLSGYIFAHVYVHDHALKTAKGQGDFAVARFARLYPLHFFMLLVAAIVYHTVPQDDAIRFAAHLVMAQALVAPVGESFVGPSWSISVEIFCYLLFTAAAFFGRRWLTAISILAVSGAGFILCIGGVEAAPTVTTGLARGLLGFFVGQLLWQVRGVMDKIPTLLLGGGVAGGLALVSGPSGPVLPLTLLAWPCLLMCAMRMQLFASAPAVWLGDRSYAIYLSHIIFIDVLFILGTFDFTSDPRLLGVLYIALMLSVLAVADMLYRRLERPARDAIRSWHSERQAGMMPA
jgi:peptidoglycan/LPS O-acetylase OafA/YrhL